MSSNLTTMQAAGSPAGGPPSWFRLQTGERFLRRWGRSSCCTGAKNGAGTAVIGVLAAIVGGAISGLAGKDDGPGRARDMGDWIAIGVALAVMLGVVVYVLIRRRTGFSAVLSDRRLAFREKGRQSEIRLADITRVEAQQLGKQPAARIHIRQMNGPALTLPLRDLTELETICNAALAAGARLR